MNYGRGRGRGAAKSVKRVFPFTSDGWKVLLSSPLPFRILHLFGRFLGHSLVLNIQVADRGQPDELPRVHCIVAGQPRARRRRGRPRSLHESYKECVPNLELQLGTRKRARKVTSNVQLFIHCTLVNLSIPKQIWIKSSGAAWSLKSEGKKLALWATSLLRPRFDR